MRHIRLQRLFYCLLAGALLCSTHLFAQTISVRAGADFSLGAGSITAGCIDLIVQGEFSVNSGSVSGLRNVTISSGTLSGGSGNISLSGNWANQGGFDSQTGSVVISDGCGVSRSSLDGNSMFYKFAVTTNSGKFLQHSAESVSSFETELRLEGTASDPLKIRSSIPGTAGEFVLSTGASQRIFGVDVADINASRGETIAPAAAAQFKSSSAGNTPNWFAADPNTPATPVTPVTPVAPPPTSIPVDTLPTSMLAILALLLLMLGSKVGTLTQPRLSEK